MSIVKNNRAIRSSNNSGITGTILVWNKLKITRLSPLLISHLSLRNNNPFL